MKGIRPFTEAFKHPPPPPQTRRQSNAKLVFYVGASKKLQKRRGGVCVGVCVGEGVALSAGRGLGPRRAALGRRLEQERRACGHPNNGGEEQAVDGERERLAEKLKRVLFALQPAVLPKRLQTGLSGGYQNPDVPQSHNSTRRLACPAGSTPGLVEPGGLDEHEHRGGDKNVDCDDEAARKPKEELVGAEQRVRRNVRERRDEHDGLGGRGDSGPGKRRQARDPADGADCNPPPPPTERPADDPRDGAGAVGGEEREPPDWDCAVGPAGKSVDPPPTIGRSSPTSSAAPYDSIGKDRPR